MPTAVNIRPVTPPPQSSPSPSASPTAGDGDGASSTFHDALKHAQHKDSPGAGSSAASQPAATASAAGTSVKAAKPAKTAANAQSQETDDSDSAEPTKPAASPSPAAAAPGDDATDESEAARQSPNPKAKAATHAGHSTDETQDAQLAAAQPPADIVTAVNKDPDESSGQPKDQPDKGSASVDAIEADDGANASQEPDSAIPASLRHGALTGKGATGAAQATGPTASTDDSDAAIAAAAVAEDETDPAPATSDKGASAGPTATIEGSHTAVHTFADALAAADGQVPATNTSGASAGHIAAAKQAPVSPQVQFSQDNQAQIVRSVHTQLLPNGGTMQIRLDPPELGTMSVSVQMRNGIMTATFETSTDQAARLLTHNLGQLKTALESQGVSVGSLHVQQTPRDSQSSSNNSGKESDGSASDQTSQQQQRDQQRRAMLRQMWRRLSGGQDPLDLVA